MIIKTIKTKIILLKKDYDQVLQAIQKNEIMMISEHHYSKNENTDTEDEFLIRTKKAIEILENYLTEKKFFEFNSVDYEEFIVDSSNDFDFLFDVEKAYQSLHDKRLETTEIKEKIKLLTPFKDLSIPTKTDSQYLNFNFGYVSFVNLEHLKNALGELAMVEVLEKCSYGVSIAIGYLADDSEEVISILEDFNFIDANLAQSEKLVSEVLKEFEQIIQKNWEVILDSINKLSNYSRDLIVLKTLYDKLLNEKLRKTIKYKKIDDNVYLDGYIKECDKEKLEEIVKNETSNYNILYPNNKDKTPTATKNNKFVQPFESITNMFSVPDENEIDPNPMMSIWYVIFYGIMMGDIGYGMVMFLICFLVIKLKHPKPNTKPLLQIIMFSGVSSIFFGIIFGSFFGVDVSVIGSIGKIFNANWPDAFFKPVAEPLPVLMASIVLGAVHLICALIMKVRLSKKQKNLMEMLFGLGWIFALVGIGVLLIGMLEILPITSIPGIILIAIALVLIIISSGSRGKKFGKVSSAFGGVYGAFGYLSDLLSYSRLLALCLSSGVIAFTMNLLAGMIRTGPITFVISIFIYLIGHTFNLVLSLLSGYIHSSRLQYIEYYGKFYVGGGIEFKPLAFELNYLNKINLKEELK